MRTVPAFALLTALASLVACGSQTPDKPADYQPNPLGTGLRIADLQSPSSTYYSQAMTLAQTDHNEGKAQTGVNVIVSSVVVQWVDTYDETKDGKSVGTVYVQDLNSTAPYSGIDIYSPSYVPASLRLIVGDVLDFNGPYEEAANIGTAVFLPQTLPQLSKPVGTFRYEYQTPAPLGIQLADLNQYATGRKWENMLVTMKDITIAAGANNSGRVTYPVGQGSEQITSNSPTLSNELYALGPNDYPAGTHFSSVTGIVTWFFTFHIAPRSPADLVVGP
jgi:hypothetical protein